MKEWFEDERFWELTYPFIFTPDRMEKAEEEADEIIRLAGIPHGAVLDLCCGPGRTSIAMARRGFTVTGVDRTPMLLDTARSLAGLNGLDIEWVLEDMRDFIRPASFDLALSMYTSFGYFESHDDNLLVLRNLHDSLRPGGRLLLDTMGKEILASVFKPVTTEELEDGSLLIERHTIEHGWKRISNDWLIIREDRLEGRFRFGHWIYSALEIEEMLMEAGFSFVAVHGDLEGSPYDDQACKLVVVAARGD
jgi:SAM-dependent methyltransferase